VHVRSIKSQNGNITDSLTSSSSASLVYVTARRIVSTTHNCNVSSLGFVEFFEDVKIRAISLL